MRPKKNPRSRGTGRRVSTTRNRKPKPRPRLVDHLWRGATRGTGGLSKKMDGPHAPSGGKVTARACPPADGITPELGPSGTTDVRRGEAEVISVPFCPFEGPCPRRGEKLRGHDMREPRGAGE